MAQKSPLMKKIKAKLLKLYSEADTAVFLADLTQLLEVTSATPESLKAEPQQNHRNLPRIEDAALITYANSIESRLPQTNPLAALKAFLLKHKVNDAINMVHLLPFYPWDTDRGFSVTDYYQVHPYYGTWADVGALGEIVNLMFDFVANHASIQNPLVQGALIERHLNEDDSRYESFSRYKDFVIAYSHGALPKDDTLHDLARPRPNPVLTPYTVYENRDGNLFALLGKIDITRPGIDLTELGEGWVWTTFSRQKDEDGLETTRQVDLNFITPKVLFESIKILLFYVKNKASLIRLDAIGYIWKKLSSSSLHEPETHRLLEIIKDVMDLAAPETTLIAEVNEPQKTIHPYLGCPGHEESDLVYQFAHFPLAVYAVLTGNGSPYMKWLTSLEPFNGRQFITILGSHDGMGMKPVLGFLEQPEIDRLNRILINDYKALPNYAVLPGGKKIVYEVCATPWRLINNPKKNDPPPLSLARYRVVVALGLLVRGIPAFYINGLIGADNYLPLGGLDENRTINRQIHDAEELDRQLSDKSSHMQAVYLEIIRLLKIRRSQRAFHPEAPAAKPIYTQNPTIISALLETGSSGGDIFACVNVSPQTQQVILKKNPFRADSDVWHDLIANASLSPDQEGPFKITLNPFQTAWYRQGE